MDAFLKFMLNAGVYVPLAVSIAMACGPSLFSPRRSKIMALFGASVSFLSALLLWGAYMFSFSGTGFAFATSPTLGAAEFPSFALNAASAPLYALAGIVGFSSVVWAAISEIKNPRLYFTFLMFMQGGLMGAFASTNVLWMYMFHEFALVPTFIAMNLWGGAGRRQAAMQMAVYLTLGALVSLIGILAICVQFGFKTFEVSEIALLSVSLDSAWQYYIFGILLFGLGTLVSLFPFYTWAPRGYAAAPTSFAMLHAGVLKKFGLYVIIQLAIPALPLGYADWCGVIAALALVNVIYVGLVTMAQRDLKLMFSYSSVSHMGMCFLGIAAMSVAGVGGAILLMFGHGLSIALLFMLSNAIVNKTGEWDMNKIGGLYKSAPVLAAFFAAAVFASVGLPGFANFWGELSIFVALWKSSPAICTLAATGLIISAVYGLRAFAKVFMGEPSKELSGKMGGISDISAAQKFAASILLAALLFVGFYPGALTNSLDAELSAVPSLNQSK